jgi:hypothetical protein
VTNARAGRRNTRPAFAFLLRVYQIAATPFKETLDEEELKD